MIRAALLALLLVGCAGQYDPPGWDAYCARTKAPECPKR